VKRKENSKMKSMPSKKGVWGEGDLIWGGEKRLKGASQPPRKRKNFQLGKKETGKGKRLLVGPFLDLPTKRGDKEERNAQEGKYFGQGGK